MTATPVLPPVLTRDLAQLNTEELTQLYQRSLRANRHGFIQDISFHGPIDEILFGYQRDGGDAVFLTSPAEPRKPLGFGGLRRIDQHSAELCKLHLCASLQGEGLGEVMSRHLLQRASQLGFGRVELHVTATQKPAIGLYTKLGFTTTSQSVWTGQVGDKTLSFDVVYMELGL